MHVQDEDKTTANWIKEAQKGYIRVAVLILINKKPSHGYEIMKEIKDRSKGFWKPTAGGVYPILRDLEETKYIQGEWQTQNNRKIKVYKITETGKQILKHAILKQTEIASSMNSLFQEFAKDVLHIESKTLPNPIMPSPFSPFLEEKTEKPEDGIASLEIKRNHLKQAIKMLQKELKTLEKEESMTKNPNKSR